MLHHLSVLSRLAAITIKASCIVCKSYINGYINYYEHSSCASKRCYRVIARRYTAGKVKESTYSHGLPTRSSNPHPENNLSTWRLSQLAPNVWASALASDPSTLELKRRVCDKWGPERGAAANGTHLDLQEGRDHWPAQRRADQAEGRDNRPAQGAAGQTDVRD